MRKISLPFFVLVCSIFLGLVHCTKERLRTVGQPTYVEPKGCANDTECAEQNICVLGACTPIDNFSCEDLQVPLVQISPFDVELGEVVFGERVEQVVQITNTGLCNLHISGASLSEESDLGFRCSPCGVSAYPKTIPPNRSTEVRISYAPTSLGEAHGTLLLVTDDVSAGERGTVSIPIRAAYSGVPKLVIEPNEINFGYVAYNPGEASSRTENVRISNQGTGNAGLVINFIYTIPGSDFSVPASFDDVTPEMPIILPPYREDDPTTWIDVPVTYEPTRYANVSSALTVSANAGRSNSAVRVTTRLSGSSVGAPSIQVDPTDVTFKTNANEPLVLGMTVFKQVTISNTGRSELNIDLTLDDASRDFTISPSHIAPIAPGGRAVIGVVYAPTAASDPLNRSNPRRSADAYLRILSNDSAHILTSVNLHGWAKESIKNDILKLEMTYDNDDNSWASNDYRDVDLAIESQLMYTCKKPYTQFIPGPNNTFVVGSTRDFCAEWTQSGTAGTARWVPGGLFEEPERITLFNLGDTLAEGEIFTVSVYYMQDCSNIPTGLLADLVGLGTSALLGVLGSAVGMPLAIDPGRISDLIGSNCWDHSGTTATVKVSINGTEVAAPQVVLGARGDFQEVIHLRRHNGTFEVVDE